MRNFLPANRLPRKYTWKELNDALYEEESLSDQYSIRMGANTVAFLKRTDILPSPIIVSYRGLHIITVYEFGAVLLDDLGFKSEIVKRRMDAALQGIGKRLISTDNGGRSRSSWKIYTIATGEYESYQPGMIVQR